MELIVIAVVVVAVLARPLPPRYRWIRGAPKWGTYDQAQHEHLDHFGGAAGGHEDEEDEA